MRNIGEALIEAKLLPPGPGGRSLTGNNLLEYTRDQLGYLTRCAREYGEIVRLRFLNAPLYLLSVEQSGAYRVRSGPQQPRLHKG